MKSWSRIFLLAAPLALLLFTTGCDEVVLQNPLPITVDDRIIGSWANTDGKLAYVIKHGEDQSYEARTPDTLTNNGKPIVFYLAKAGDELFAEMQGDCNAYLFHAPEPTDTPRGCWSIFHVVLGSNSLQYDVFNPIEIAKKSLAGNVKDTDLVIGVSNTHGTGPSVADVLIEGKPDTVAPFLARYSKSTVYANSNFLHRIG